MSDLSKLEALPDNLRVAASLADAAMKEIAAAHLGTGMTTAQAQDLQERIMDILRRKNCPSSGPLGVGEARSNRELKR